MARLNVAPTSKEAVVATPSARPTPGTDATTQQLLDEAQASASKQARHAQSSAVRAAYLLNAARIDSRHGNGPVPVKRRTASHKLSRPSLIAEQPQHHVNRSRDIWALPECPEEPIFQPKPLPDNQEEDSQDIPSSPTRISVKAPDQSGGHVESRLEVPSHQRKHRLSLPNSRIENVQIEEELRPGVARCTVVSYNSKKGPGYSQCSNPGTQAIDDAGLRCQLHMQKSATQENTSSTPMRPHAQPRKTRQATEPTTSPKPANSSQNEHLDKSRNTGDAPKANSQEAVLAKTSCQVIKSQEVEGKVEARNDKEEEEGGEEEEYSNDNSEEETLENDDQDEDIATQKFCQEILSAGDHLDRVFSFVNFEERSGRCKSKLGRSIKRLCDNSCAVFLEDDVSMDTVKEITNDVCVALSSVHQVSKDRQAVFKSDAYGYIFRALIDYFSALYTWLEDRSKEPTDSLEAMDSLSSLVRNILSFKDTMTRWKVAIPQRYQGDRFIKDVNMSLITPLREVSRTFDTRLQILEKDEQGRRAISEVKRRVEKDEQEEKQKQDLVTANHERKRRWQDLHITRMDCEPDISRRKKLRIKKLEISDDIDANGFQFERVSIFRSRPVLQLPWRFPVDDNWSNAQTIVLLDGLRKYPGERALHKIFEKYCRPGGALRNFTVQDIVIKAAWIRVGYMKLKQEKGWEVPDWVTRMPPLP